ncbi:hypothetical protein KM043_009907 [Ampulex compressa]|nr:hypothetical protein KM043_009907 [Ampulex compressa]
MCPSYAEESKVFHHISLHITLSPGEEKRKNEEGEEKQRWKENTRKSLERRDAEYQTQGAFSYIRPTTPQPGSPDGPCRFNVAPDNRRTRRASPQGP